MHRHDLTDHEWNAIRSYLPANGTSRRGRPWKNHRTVINGILWILATGSPWRDVPERYGRWKTVYNRFRRWRDEDDWNGLMTKVLKRMDKAGKLNRSLWCVDGTVVRAHRSASGRLRQSDENDALNALGRSRGGYSTKLHVLTRRQINRGQVRPLAQIAALAGQAEIFQTIIEPMLRRDDLIHMERCKRLRRRGKLTIFAGVPSTISRVALSMLSSGV